LNKVVYDIVPVSVFSLVPYLHVYVRGTISSTYPLTTVLYILLTGSECKLSAHLTLEKLSLCRIRSTVKSMILFNTNTLYDGIIKQ